jgi:D-alanyl-D-alanine endopeptidase (penicillin-binding protein 7)
MFKSALGVFFSLLWLLCVAPSAVAAESTKSATAKKHAAKKAAVRHGAKRQAAGKKRVRVTLAGNGSSYQSRNRMVRKVVLVHGKRRVSYYRVAYSPSMRAMPPVLTAGDLAGLNRTRDPLELKSNVALVMDHDTSEVLFEKNSHVALPIASITKLMTSLVVVEANQDLNELLTVTEDDVDREKNSHSRLRVGSQLTRANMLHIALMSSENRAASALGRHYPGGIRAFVSAMNTKAQALGMTHTRYVDSTGLSSNNVASAGDLAKLVTAAYQHPIIRQYSTDTRYAVEPGGSILEYRNSNHLVENPDWEIGLQKTGFISEAGRCLVMLAKIEGRPIIMVFLDSKGKMSRLADAGRIRKWLETPRETVMPPREPTMSRTAGAVQS